MAGECDGQGLVCHGLLVDTDRPVICWPQWLADTVSPSENALPAYVSLLSNCNRCAHYAEITNSPIYKCNATELYSCAQYIPIIIIIIITMMNDGRCRQ